jgi:hypothetical protein
MNSNPLKSTPQWQENLWRFVYDNIAVSDFENWVYAAKELETILDSDTYLRLLEANYHDHLQIYELQKALKAWLNTFYPLACECLSWKDYQVIPIVGHEKLPQIFLAKFRVLKKRTPWIDLVTCISCDQMWYLAMDTTNDDYYLQRLTVNDVDEINTGSWPTVFDNLEPVWPSKEWLKIYGFKSLVDWQNKNHA